MSGDQSLVHLWAHRFSDRTHRLLYRHYGGETGWSEVRRDQGVYPYLYMYNKVM